jgi:alpha-1,3-mannosyltransferase
MLPAPSADFWVARDIEGRKLGLDFPFTGHGPSEQQLRQGLPVPVHCCWNGLTVVRAQPFLAGLRVRAHQEGECAASECSLLCDDMHRLGYRDVRLDPSVRVAYQQHVFNAMHSTPSDPQAQPGYMPYTCIKHYASDWRYWRRGGFERSNFSECCPLPAGHDHLDWAHNGCHMRDIFTDNYTASFLAGAASSSMASTSRRASSDSSSGDGISGLSG